MRSHFLGSRWVGAWLAVGASVIGLAMASCGGKVAVDGNGAGQGGQGGAGGSTSSSLISTADTGSGNGSFSSGSTKPPPDAVGSGPGVCSCDQFCDTLKSCGAPGGQCETICNNVSDDQRACVCDVGSNCGALPGCFGGGPGGGPSGGPGSSGSGDPPPFGCSACADQASNNECAMLQQACEDNPACVEVADCSEQCGYGPECDACMEKFPEGADDFFSLVQCVVCDSCINQCQGLGVDHYCFDNSP